MSKAVGKKAVKSAMANVIHGKLRTNVPAGKAAPGSNLGNQLGQRGINIAAFCKDFNARTAHYVEGVPLPIRVTVNPDRSYKLVINNPTGSFLIKQAAGIQRGAMQYNKETVGWITLKHVYEIAVIKSRDPSLELTPLKQICEMVIGQATHMGIKVVRDYDPEEYGEFLQQQRVVVQRQLDECKEKREALILRK
ncbi:Ribosomal protein L11/L12 [Trinorchestia longiramus]|nr:Ribosomal protein L11/L12 [Trinorchestia longiramus]